MKGIASRMVFWSRAIVRGWQEVVSLRDHLELVIIIVVALGVLVGVTSIRLSVPIWIHASGIVVAVMAVAVLDGAYLEATSMRAASPLPAASVVEGVNALLRDGRLLRNEFFNSEFEERRSELEAKYQSWLTNAVVWIRENIPDQLELFLADSASSTAFAGPIWRSNSVVQLDQRISRLIQIRERA